MTEPHDDGGPISFAADMLYAPWSDTQVRAIQAWQAAGSVHPLTCAISEHGPLMVDKTGLWCQSCDFQQTCVPRMCAETFPSDYAPPLVTAVPVDSPPLAAARTGERVAALVIAIRLMEMHLELATPGGAGRDSIAWTVATKRVQVLRDLLAELRTSQPEQPATD